MIAFYSAYLLDEEVNGCTYTKQNVKQKSKSQQKLTCEMLPKSQTTHQHPPPGVKCISKNYEFHV